MTKKKKHKTTLTFPGRHFDNPEDKKSFDSMANQICREIDAEIIKEIRAKIEKIMFVPKKHLTNKT